jgi:hypothetical protein
MLHLLILVSAATSANASLNWAELVQESHKTFVADFARDRGNTPSQDAVGFTLERTANGGSSQVFYVDGSQVGSFSYGCESSGTTLKCDRTNTGDFRAYARTSKSYSSVEMIKSVGLALELFQKRVAPVASVTGLRFWEADRELHFEIRFEKNGPQKSFLSCHFHGNEGLDCHRERNAGPNPPQKD